MRRYRILGFDFDARVQSLTRPMDDFPEELRESQKKSREETLEDLAHEFGADDFDAKVQNFIDIGPKPLSILAYHNKFFGQSRRAFVIGAYYPALTGVCSLGERILTHLVLRLRDDFKSSPHYKDVYQKKSFPKWEPAITPLEAWGVLLPESAEFFRKLCVARNNAVHFDPTTDADDRPLALEAIKLMTKIVLVQFAAFGPLPWMLTGVPGEMYIRKEAETQPFVRELYLPNCRLLGPMHEIDEEQLRYGRMVPIDGLYEGRELTDDEFCRLRMAKRETPMNAKRGEESATN